MSKHGFALLLDDTGRLALEVGGPEGVSRVTSPDPVQARRWLFVAATVGANRSR